MSKAIDMLWNVADEMTRAEESELERLMGKQAFQHPLDASEQLWIKRMMRKYPWCRRQP